VCSIRHGRGTYSLKPAADARVTVDGSALEDNAAGCREEAVHVQRCAEDSAAGIFVFNSFICGAVARSLRSRPAEDVTLLPAPFGNFFGVFWDQLQMLVADGVHLPGHVTKFLPMLGAASHAAVQGCASMWTLAFDGGATAACAVAAAAMLMAPHCSRYIDEVAKVVVFAVLHAFGSLQLPTGWPSCADVACFSHDGNGGVHQRPAPVLPWDEGSL
jgi:hypothetical protein